MVAKSGQDRHKKPQEPPKGTQKAPKRHPRAFKKAPKSTQKPPKSIPEHIQMHQKGFKIAPERGDSEIRARERKHIHLGIITKQHDDCRL